MTLDPLGASPARSDAGGPRLTARDRFTSPGFLVATIGKVAHEWIADAMAPLGLQPREAAALLILRTHGVIQQQRLGELLHLDANYLVLVLKRLERDGLVARTRDPADRRRHLLSITTKGSTLRDEVDRRVEEVEARLMGGLDDGEQEALTRLLFKIDDVTGRSREFGERP